MSREDPSLREAERGRLESTEALAKPRYDQSHPAKSQGWSGSQGVGTTANMQHEAALTHVATTATDGGESTYTYDSSRDLAAYFHDVDGRRFSRQAGPYMLPADETEFWRLDKQHTALLIGLGELYPCPDLVERVMAPRPGETIEIVDLGCGTGTWALSMARRFLHATVLGLDVAPVPLNPEILTPNIQFLIEDINVGLSNYVGRFDLVHMRCLGGGLLDYSQAITNAASCLKPGGLLIVGDMDMLICAEDMVTAQKMATPNQPEGSWVQRYLNEFLWAYGVNGMDVLGYNKMMDRGLWNHPLLGGCGAAGLHIPLGSWAKEKSTDSEEAQRLGFSGILLRQNIKGALQSTQPLLKKAGIPEGVLEEWVPKCEEELDSQKIHSWMQLRLVWGQRNNTNIDSSPSDPSTDADNEVLNFQESNWAPHRQVHVYRSAEECESARQKRRDTLGEFVNPLALAF